MSKQNNRTIVIIIILVVIIALAVVAWFIWGQNKTEKNSNNAVTNSVVNGANTNQAVLNTNQTTNVSTADWQTYTNTEYHYSLKHPANFTVSGKAQPSNDGQIVFLPMFSNIPAGVTSTEDGQANFYITRFSTNQTLSAWFAQNGEMNDALKQAAISSMQEQDTNGHYVVGDITATQSDTTIAGFPAIVQDTNFSKTPVGPIRAREYFFKNGDYVYRFQGSTSATASAASVLKIFDSFVGTFTITQ